MAAPSTAYFDEYSEKYMCCCGCMHSQMGAKIICGLGCAGILISIVGLIGGGGGSSAFAAIGMAISVLAVICLLIAICTDKQVLLIPYLILMVLNIFSYIGLFIFVLVNSSALSGGGFVAATAIVCGIVILLDLWFAFVIFGYYKFLRDKNTAAPRVYNYAS